MTPHTRALTEEASQFFDEQVRQLPGVLRVLRLDDALPGGKSFRVSIWKGDRETRYAVYQAEVEMRLRYEGASLDIRVIEEAQRTAIY